MPALHKKYYLPAKNLVVFRWFFHIQKVFCELYFRMHDSLFSAKRIDMIKLKMYNILLCKRKKII